MAKEIRLLSPKSTRADNERARERTIKGRQARFSEYERLEILFESGSNRVVVGKG
jgi:DNA repair protein RadC